MNSANVTLDDRMNRFKKWKQEFLASLHPIERKVYTQVMDRPVFIDGVEHVFHYFSEYTRELVKGKKAQGPRCLWVMPQGKWNPAKLVACSEVLQDWREEDEVQANTTV